MKKIRDINIRGSKIHDMIIKNTPSNDIILEIKTSIEKYNKNKKNKRKISLNHYIYSNNCLLLRCASKYNQLELMKYLVSNGANIHAVNNQSLLEACQRGHADIVKYLLEQGAKVHVFSNKPLRTICSKTQNKESYHIIKSLLLQYGALPYEIPFTNNQLRRIRQKEYELNEHMRSQHECYLMYCEEFQLNIPEYLYKI